MKTGEQSQGQDGSDQGQEEIPLRIPRIALPTEKGRIAVLDENRAEPLEELRIPVEPKPVLHSVPKRRHIATTKTTPAIAQIVSMNHVPTSLGLTADHTSTTRTTASRTAGVRRPGMGGR